MSVTEALTAGDALERLDSAIAFLLQHLGAEAQRRPQNLQRIEQKRLKLTELRTAASRQGQLTAEQRHEHVVRLHSHEALQMPIPEYNRQPLHRALLHPCLPYSPTTLLCFTKHACQTSTTFEATPVNAARWELLVNDMHLERPLTSRATRSMAQQQGPGSADRSATSQLLGVSF